MPYFSVIVPVYRVAPWLGACVDSLRGQTFTDWEAVCVDDGSPDNCGELLDETVRSDGRFRVIHQRNGGVSTARNRALASARGEVLTFLDGDDVVAPGWLARFQEGFASTQTDVVRGRFRAFEDGKALPEADDSPETQTYAGEALNHWGWHTFSEGGWVFLCAWKRSVAADARFPVGLPFKEDCIYCFQVLARATRVTQLESAHYFYRQRSTSAVHQAHPLSERLRFLEALAEVFDGMDVLPEAARRMATTICWQDVCNWLRVARPKAEVQQLHAAFCAMMTRVQGRVRWCGKAHWWLPFLLFRMCGITWGVRLVNRLLGLREETP